jgi:hypothetical protein
LKKLETGERTKKIMAQPANRVLKSDDVEVDGRLHLDLGGAVPPTQNGRNVAVGKQSVRILENQNEYAVMEVTCSCGRKTIIRCDYAGATRPTGP